MLAKRPTVKSPKVRRWSGNVKKRSDHGTHPRPNRPEDENVRRVAAFRAAPHYGRRRPNSSSGRATIVVSFVCLGRVRLFVATCLFCEGKLEERTSLVGDPKQVETHRCCVLLGGKNTSFPNKSVLSLKIQPQRNQHQAGFGGEDYGALNFRQINKAWDHPESARVVTEKFQRTWQHKNPRGNVLPPPYTLPTV